MTKRKPPGMKFGSWIERQIHAAQAAGEFDDLPGQGRPDPNLKWTGDPHWWAKKLLKREGLSFLPPALELKKEVETGLEEISELTGEDAVRARVRRLNAKIRRMNAVATKGPPTSVAPLDEEEVVERWKHRQR